jgi:CRP/FNR family transcriptional regulator
MKNIKKIIAQLPLFQGLAPQQLEEIRNITIDRQYQKGEYIFSEGDEGNGFYVIITGSVEIYKASLEGKEKILHIFGPGEPFGEVPVFSGDRFPANARTLAKTHLLFFPRQAFVNLIAANPALALKMMAVLSLRLRQFTVQIEHLTLKEVPGRLAAYLIYSLQEQNDDGSRITLTISKGQLASLLGTIPETLSRILARMVKQKLIKVDGKEIHVLDPEGLEVLSEYGRVLE